MHRRRLVAGLGLSAAIVIATAVPSIANDPPKVLLSQQETTVLGQPLAYPTQQPAQVSSSIITLKPGERTGRHRHDAPMFVTVLSGVLTVDYDGGVTKRLRKGDAMLEALGTWHEGRNAGRVPVRILVVNMGAEGVANTVVAP